MASPKILTSVNRTVVFFNTNGALVGRPSTPTVALPTIEILSATTPIEGNNAVFTVRLSKPWSEAISFAYATSNGGGTSMTDALAGTDYTNTSGTGTIPANASSTTVNVPTTLREGDNGNREFTLTISDAETASEQAVTITTASLRAVIADSTVPVGDHGYYEALLARGDFWKALSLRDQSEIDLWSKPIPNEDVTYAPEVDTDAQKQDAAKVVLSCFPPTPVAKLVSGIDDSQLTIPMTDFATGQIDKLTTGFNAKGAVIRVGNEYMVTAQNNPFDRPTGVLTLQTRGAHGSSASAHDADTPIFRSGNSLRNQVHFPLNTSDDHSYLFTWDVFFTDSFLENGIGQFKTFQMRSNRSIWLESRTDFSGADDRDNFDPELHIATFNVRSYNTPNVDTDYATTSLTKLRSLGPGHPDNDPIVPNEGTFIIHPGRWTRIWHRITQRANDYDLLSTWIADEVQDPVQILQDARISVRAVWQSGAWVGSDTINTWEIEFNTSTAFLPPERVTDFRDLVAYVRNFAALVDPPSDVTSLLQKPQ